MSGFMAGGTPSAAAADSEHLKVELTKIRFLHGNHIGFVTRIFGGLLYERVQLLRLHAVVTQLRVETKASTELDNKLNGALIGLRIGTVRQVEAAGDADPAV